MKKAVFVLMTILLMAGAQRSRAEEASPADEAKEAAAEDEEEKSLSEADQILAIKSVRGKLTLNSSDGGEDGADAIGMLTEDGGKIYLLKLEKMELLKTLRTFNGKTVALQGKLRNKGKYLVVSAVTEPGGGAAPDRKKRGGI